MVWPPDGTPKSRAVWLVVLDHHVLALDIAGFAEGAAERRRVAHHATGRPRVYDPDDGHRWLLRAPRNQPRRRAAEQRDEIAPQRRDAQGAFHLSAGMAGKIE